MGDNDSEALFYQLGLCQIQEDRSPELISDQDREDQQKEVDRIQELERSQFNKLGQSNDSDLIRLKRMTLVIYGKDLVDEKTTQKPSPTS